METSIPRLHFTGPRISPPINYPKAHFVKMPNAAHGTIFYSKSTCGMEIFGSFVRSNGESIDTSCIKKLNPIDWEGTTEKSKQISRDDFGTTELWGKADA